MEIVIRCAVLGIICSVLGLMIKKSSPEMALLLSISAGLLILYNGLTMINGVRVFMDEVTVNTGISPALLSPVIKSIGIAIAGRLAADVCKDAGNTASASAVEIAAAGASIYVSIPLMRTVLEMLRGIM